MVKRGINFLSHSKEEMQHLGKAYGEILSLNSVVAFSGELGAGKTTFIQGIVEGLEGKSAQEVTSPTFVYLNIYAAKWPVYHFDLYRIENSEEFLSMGFEEFFSAGGICLIEWAEKIQNILPSHTLFVDMRYKNFEEREISL